MARIRNLTATAAQPPASKLHANADAYSTAMTNWLHAQILATDITEYRAEIAALESRVLNGRAWLSKHGENHPRYAHNQCLLDELRWKLTMTRFRYSGRILACRCAVWAVTSACEAFSIAERTQWLYETGIRVTDDPGALWTRLELEGEPMGELPPADRAFWWMPDDEWRRDDD